MIVDKISRLTPDQQREVEDFIDFLITRDSDTSPANGYTESGKSFSLVGSDTAPSSPVIFAGEHPAAGHSDQDILPDYPEYGGSGIAANERLPEKRIIVPRRTEKEPGRLLDWID
jgi:hypothetical protein